LKIRNTGRSAKRWTAPLIGATGALRPGLRPPGTQLAWRWRSSSWMAPAPPNPVFRQRSAAA